MNTQLWIQHFEDNAVRSQALRLPAAPCTLPDRIRGPLMASLAVFQLGESGGGTRLRRYARATAPIASLRGYQRAIDLFIAEEQGHAELLGRVLDHLGGSRLTKQWTNSVFRRLRVLVNLEFNIQVLLTAELIAEVYYGTLLLRVNDDAVRVMSRKILADEMRHLAFQRDFLSDRLAQFSPSRLRWWLRQFRFIHHCTALVVAWDHRHFLHAIGMSPRLFMRRAVTACTHFERRLLRQVEAVNDTAIAVTSIPQSEQRETPSEAVRRAA